MPTATTSLLPAGTISALGCARTLRGLVAEGYSTDRLTAELNWPPGLVDAFTRGARWFVRRELADHAAATAERLRFGNPPPRGDDADRARRRAREAGWPPLWAWDDVDDPDCRPHATEPADWVRVDRAVAGLLKWGDLNLAEREQAHRRLAALGVSQNQTAVMLGVAPATLKDFVTALGRPGGPVRVRRRAMRGSDTHPHAA